MRRTLPVLLCVTVLVVAVPLNATRQPLRARHGMVVAMEAIAADLGVSVLQKGGNAVDAAVAVGFALAVTHPFAGNIGGGGFMLIRFADGRSTFIDFRERAPEKASRMGTPGPAFGMAKPRPAVRYLAPDRASLRTWNGRSPRPVPASSTAATP